MEKTRSSEGSRSRHWTRDSGRQVKRTRDDWTRRHNTMSTANDAYVAGLGGAADASGRAASDDDADDDDGGDGDAAVSSPDRQTDMKLTRKDGNKSQLIWDGQRVKDD